MPLNIAVHCTWHILVHVCIYVPCKFTCMCHNVYMSDTLSITPTTPPNHCFIVPPPPPIPLVPLTYSYLSEGSILAALLSVLRDLTASPLVQSTVPLVRAALGVLGASMASLPPVDFSDILLPICEYSTSLGGVFVMCVSLHCQRYSHTPSP